VETSFDGKGRRTRIRPNCSSKKGGEKEEFRRKRARMAVLKLPMWSCKKQKKANAERKERNKKRGKSSSKGHDNITRP